LRLLVCGSRTIQPACNAVSEVLTGIYTEWSVGWQCAHLEPFHLAHGDASGADSLANWWASFSPLCGPTYVHPSLPTDEEMWGLPSLPVVVRPFPADWVGPCDPEFCKPGHRRTRSSQEYCPAAGPRRNRRMLAEFEPTRVVAFVDKPLAKSKGTADMVNIARAAGVEVVVVQT
jgi:hypothetical protein